MLKVSVIIPIYNTEHYLKKCLDSVINQSYTNIEIICVDNNSTDNSVNIVNKYAQIDNRIKLIKHKVNEGLAASRNTGINYAKGDLIYFLDSDDYIKNNLFEYAITIFNNFDIDFFCFSSEPFADDKDKIIQNFNGIKEYIKIKCDGLFDMNFDIALNTNVHVWNKIYKKSIIKKYNLKFIEGLNYEDIFFTWAYNFISHKVYYEPEIMHHYRIRSTSIMEKHTQNKSYQNTVDHLKNWYMLYLFVQNNKYVFKENYNHLMYLLNFYRNRSKELCPLNEKYKLEKLYLEYRNLLEKQINESLKTHNVFNLLGIKIKIRRNK